ncbi:MAG: caspase family protein, partial [Chloroflexi bacterium]|nr:caspase family protein [Chloroflexota bacterium]
MSPPGNGSKLYALLIGIDYYLPNLLPSGIYYPHLDGCVRDIRHVEEFLERKLDPPPTILTLTSTYTDPAGAGRSTSKGRPAEPKTRWPTYKNMVRDLKKMTKLAQPGDMVYVHYAGHGGRSTTIFPELKGENGLDESLVPMDIDKSEGRYLRDVELAHLFKAMVDKGLVVTIVFDSCHSGGATRGRGGAKARGIGVVDTTPRPTKSLVAAHSKLVATWAQLSAGRTRDVKPSAGWLLEPQGYVLLAACRASESANEYPFDGKEYNGALTYWLLDSLKQLGPGLTYKTLHERILAKVHSQFPDQTPQLQGEGNRAVFGSEQVAPQYVVPVLDVNDTKQAVLLNAGQAQGIRKGAQFAIYPPATTDLSQVTQRLALAEVSKLGASESWAKVQKKLRPEPIEQGGLAVLLDPGTSRLQRTMRTFVQEATIVPAPLARDGVPAAIDQSAALQKVEDVLKSSGSGFVQLAPEGQPADFQVVVNAAGEYEIWDPAGRPIPNLRPALSIAGAQAAERIVQRLIHLTKYRNVLELDNRDPMSPLARKLTVELLGMQTEYDPADEPEPQPFAEAGNTPKIKVGEWTFLRVRNDMPPGPKDDPSRILNITVLDLLPGWGIKQIYPAGAGFFEPLDPGQ